MGKIVILDELTVNKIAAGEVVERPASVIKEMVENSIDAGASQITVEIKRGGITYIRITDNGSGIDYDDILLAFEKHATSKISCGDDLEAINTLGFRGEALSSISAVAKVDVVTKTRGEDHGIKVSVYGGKLMENTFCGCPDGTTFVVKDLFFNTPARYKFLKKDATEAGHVIDLIERIALAHPEIAFRLISNGSEIIRTRGDGSLKNVIYGIYGREIAEDSKEISFTDKGIEITGFAGGISSASSGRGRQSIFINGRYVKSKVVYSAIDEAYKTLMMKGKYPFIILNIAISPRNVDVNVHPTKMEVRFSDDGAVYRWVNAAVGTALFKADPVIQEHDDSFENGILKKVYAAPFDNMTRSQAREIREEYKNSLQELPAMESTAAVKETTVRKEPEYYIDEPKKNMPRKETPQEEGAIEEDTENNSVGLKESEAGYEKAEEYEYKKTISREQDILKNAIYIGQAFETYIILQYKDEVILMDQHAAHERVMYEKIKKQYASAEKVTQTLLAPVAVEFSASEYSIYKDSEKYFSQLGFDIEDFGDNAVLIREIPAFIDVSSAAGTVRDIIKDIIDGKENTSSKRISISDEAINMMACKAAVKANHKLGPQEVKTLLNSLYNLKNPFTCPHGRPTTVSLTKNQLEKMFKRVL